MPKKKEPPLSAEEQRRWFEALAREAKADGSTKQLKRTLGRIALTPRTKERPANKK